MEPTNERMHILEMIENGRISAEEGLGLLQALNAAEMRQAEAVVEPRFDRTPVLEPIPPDSAIPDPNQPEPVFAGTAQEIDPAPTIRKWKRWWMIPLWIGVGVTVFGGLFMYLAQQASGLGFWFLCAAVPFVIGLVVIVLAWQSRSAPWLHLRVQQPPGRTPERIAFSFPLPIQLAQWFLRTFGHWIPGMGDQSWDQVLAALKQQANPETPIVIQVDEAESGEKVEIFIG